MEKTKKILIVAGEASGDLHAANLVAAVNRKFPRAEWFGLGGSLMRKTGVDVRFDLTGIAVVGFWEVLKNLARFKRIFADIVGRAEEEKPDLAILVDYPGFNLRLAKELALRNIPVFYYISPQVWAWGAERIRAIRASVARMIVFFDFEERLYRAAGVPVSFVGHPLLDTARASVPRETFLRDCRLSPGKLTVALLPGSREKEVKSLLPVMVRCSSIIRDYLDDRVQFVVLRSSTVKEKVYSRFLAGSDLPVKLVTDRTYDALGASDAALVCSGTATLETALMHVPMAIVYKVSFLTWCLARLAIRIPYIGLVNVVKGRQIVPEFIQFDADPEKICDYFLSLLQDKAARARMRSDLESVGPALGEPGATDRAASIIVDFLRQS
ncbi:MAG: lipid-A-disaccharide synthase [Candidatus Omnitrophica bacterium]|nr:lipid-A-disaccharide synthase [Candidatus Omnitrophota bacterium]